MSKILYNNINKEPTGFLDPSAVVINYDPTTQKITLTGTITAYYRGTNIAVANPTFVSGWLSAAHSNVTGPTGYTGYTGPASTAISIETGTGGTYSLTTTAGQRVVVWAKGSFASTPTTITLAYNGVTKDQVTIGIQDPSNNKGAFAMMYTEIPGAATHNITVSAGTDIVIIVMKLG